MYNILTAVHVHVISNRIYIAKNMPTNYTQLKSG